MTNSIESLKASIINPQRRDLSESFLRAVNLVRVLRSECPWDRKQTRKSLAHLLLEESYELVHAIDEGDESELKKELGDLFLHICFQAVLAEESGSFGFDEVFNTLCEKLISRHPHVFGETVAETEQAVLKNWETLKMKEGRKSLLDGVPKAMSELLRAYRVQKKVAGVGFDWKTGDEVLDKLAEEIAELNDASTKEEREDEFGDLLFTIVNYSRFIGVNPEDSLRKATGKFMSRFAAMEREVQASGRPWQEYSPEDLDVLWNKAKSDHR
ncbi:MAG: nucleoside triphosphate pyrophosphohydrolase [Chlorobium sp.]|uniref:nucleoside triphosphate pyrophosphohydrolase n=1 Tax=Chlorobium sp. TaxID=1095 RepID=UPI001DFFCF0B|nr:nucleoside triphosphate pyrophosphohydrolase [Chlorobium sp.]MBN1278479.1 nucleoside triphosphate pyrophosphohydrolase [Chlorobiaceae bacterium]MCF8215532.1 nucleoside triphosphate pyrophosphohydrolase [Chlorobium sp.]MCF8270414.1 nucleoside triphosphate pyrophosphohydrolase [Chlorobium sp.]MCF8286784.1 nucleoside triphosphate pyrophosphohydrolase [Chlorobium sp.]MCF8290306.1 nucleoside triphosphate pyrophosphohydrolase [Chlorobium sp.]